jgi:DNA invertase Pin-like site-specific DNA recombinase
MMPITVVGNETRAFDEFLGWSLQRHHCRCHTRQPTPISAVCAKVRFLHHNQAIKAIEVFCCAIPVQNRPMIYGYARVSTDGQSVTAQVAALRKNGAGKVFREVASGAKTDRTQLRRLLDQLDALAPGDVVTVTRIDRLARSTFDLFAIVKRIVDAEAQFRSLAEPWADTGTSTGRLMLAVLGGLADVERDLIRTRTAEGRSRAKTQGQHMGDRRSSHAATAERGHQTPRGGRYARRTRSQLRRR